MGEITLGPVFDQDDEPFFEPEPPPPELAASFGVHHGTLKLLCACLEPICSGDVAQGYHRCGRSIRVVLS